LNRCTCVIRRYAQRLAQAFDCRIGPTLVVQQIAKIVPSLGIFRIDPRGSSESRFRFDITAVDPEHISEIERRRCIRWIAFHLEAVEPLGFDNISHFLSASNSLAKARRCSLPMAGGDRGRA
jgi:hypothetical protein